MILFFYFLFLFVFFGITGDVFNTWGVCVLLCRTIYAFSDNFHTIQITFTVWCLASHLWKCMYRKKYLISCLKSQALRIFWPYIPKGIYRVQVLGAESSNQGTAYWMRTKITTKHILLEFFILDFLFSLTKGKIPYFPYDVLAFG